VRVAESYLLLGRLGRAEGNLAAAVADYRKAAAIQVADRPTRERARADWMTGYLDTLIDLGRAQPAEQAALGAEAFAAAQIPRGGETARAITNMTRGSTWPTPRCGRRARSTRKRAASAIASARPSRSSPSVSRRAGTRGTRRPSSATSAPRRRRWRAS
jgi:hypothetical protein